MPGNPASVECPECGESFDPTAMGGWCTNKDCGEYQWEPDEASAVSGPASDDEVHTADSPTADTGDVATDSGPAVNSDESETKEEEVICSDCGETVPEKQYCMQCGSKLSPEEDKEEETKSEPEEEAETKSSLDTCPSCGEEVQEAWSACPFCQEDLDQHRQSTKGTSSADEASTEATNDADEASTETKATDDTDEASAKTNDSLPERVIVSVGDDDLEVKDGGSIGSEVRAAYVDAGGDADEAQWISREHVRFEREDDTFYVIHKGTNETLLNGEELDDDERRPVSDGDTIDFAGVTTGTVRLE